MANIILRDDRDPTISYVGIWGLAGTTSEYQGTTHFSKSNGSSFSFSFNGTSISVFGTVPSLGNAYNMTATSTYALDDLEPVNSTAPITSSVLYNHRWYASPSLEDGQHTIIVATVSVNSNAVFWFDYLQYAQRSDGNSTLQSLTSVPAALPSTPTTQSNSSTASSGPSKSMITILTAVLVPLSIVLAAIVVLLIYCGRRRRKAHLKASHIIDSDPFVSFRGSNYVSESSFGNVRGLYSSSHGTEERIHSPASSYSAFPLIDRTHGAMTEKQARVGRRLRAVGGPVESVQVGDEEGDLPPQYEQPLAC